MRKPIDRPVYAIGLDLSLRASAACAIPIGWNQSIVEVRTATFDAEKISKEGSDLERLRRMEDISEKVITFIHAFRDPVSLTTRENNAPAIFVEEMAFGQSGAMARENAGLAWIVRWKIWRVFDVIAHPVIASQARKALLQKLPRKDVKKFTLSNVRRLGGQASKWTDGEADSFVIANRGVELSGGMAMTFEGIVT